MKFFHLRLSKRTHGLHVEHLHTGSNREDYNRHVHYQLQWRSESIHLVFEQMLSYLLYEEQEMRLQGTLVSLNPIPSQNSTSFFGVFGNFVSSLCLR
jgi:hypothetical protein